MLSKTLHFVGAFGSWRSPSRGPALPAEPTSPARRSRIPAHRQQQRPRRLADRTPGRAPKVGIPDFVTPAGVRRCRRRAKTMADVLEYDLDFEREFLVVSRTASASIPAAATPEALPLPAVGRARRGLSCCSARCARPAKDARSTCGWSASAARRPDRASGSPTTAAGRRTRATARTTSPTISTRRFARSQGVARTRLAFTSDRDATQMPGPRAGRRQPGKEIYISDYDGCEPAAAHVNRNLNIMPKWGPDPRTLAYTSYVIGLPGHLRHAARRPPAARGPRAGNDDMHNMLPAISPDGTKVAFASTRGTSNGHWDIWVVERDGNELAEPDAQHAEQHRERADLVAARACRSRSRRIARAAIRSTIMNADGTGRAEDQFRERADRPSWSPLNYIAYTAETVGRTRHRGLRHPDAVTKILTDGNGSNEGPDGRAQRPARGVRHVALGQQADRDRRLSRRRNDPPHHPDGHQHVSRAGRRRRGRPVQNSR